MIVEWVKEDGALVPKMKGVKALDRETIAWAAQPGSQDYFLRCPILECCYEGTRGPGKTDALLMDFNQHTGEDDRTDDDRKKGVPQMRGWGREWRGVLFRRTFPELEDVIEKSKKWFSQFQPDAFFNSSRNYWRWPTGERLYFRPFPKASSYWTYHGHAYPWIGWEELGTWPDDSCYLPMFSCSRSTMPNMPRKIRSTTNPYGPGHNWVKARFRLPVLPGHVRGQVIRDSTDQSGFLEPPRVAIHGQLNENKVLMCADPGYVSKLAAGAPNAAARQAWLFGGWDIVAGGMFDDVWYECRDYAVIPPFDVPAGWKIDRSFDWGDARPFATLWWAESNGEDLVFPDGSKKSTVRGDLFLIREYYGWNGKPNEGLRLLDYEIAQNIVEREVKWGINGRVRPGPADSSIFDDTNGSCVARGMSNVVRIGAKAYAGVRWIPANKGPGTRKQGWTQLRSYLNATIPSGRGPREKPGLFIVGPHCPQWLRTVPVLPRDEKDPDDVDSSTEDHVGDATRYRLVLPKRERRSGSTRGHY